MNIVHIIGNGFDLNQGLPTSYAHFYEFYFQLVPQEKDTEAVRKIRELLEWPGNLYFNWNNEADVEDAYYRECEDYHKWLEYEGNWQCGKSATLNELKELLRKAGKSISLSEHPYCEMPETFEYQFRIVCVALAGDTREVVGANCGYFKQKGCDVAISATRTKGGSVDALNEFAAKEGVEIEWIAKSYEYNLSEETQKMCNKETAEVVLMKI